VVILDLVMPNMDGEQTLEALRRIDPNVRVLISSGQTELKRVRGLLRSGAQGFLQKPYDAGAVGEAISSATFGPRGWRGVKKRT
jgi:DNA-binding NarL/FixJ family response regulator